MFTYEIALRNEKGDVLRNFGGSFVTNSLRPYLLVSDLINFASETSEQANKADNTASMPCNCVVKSTEVLGMCIIYPRKDCPIHGQLHSTHC